MDILEKIISRRLLRIDQAKRAKPVKEVMRAAEIAREAKPRHVLTSALAKDRVNIIAEFKRCSPSKGMIRENADAAKTGRLYESAGAAAISVLTEGDFFCGSLEDLRAIRATVSLPILRKDFIVDEYQIFETAAAGADALLLIVAALDDATLAKFMGVTVSLGLEALVEVHDQRELERALANNAKLIGVNNRDLRNFAVSTDTSRQLAKVAGSSAILVSESGLNPAEVQGLRKIGYRGFLVGETLMRASDQAAALREFLN
jgi:indole-3-glycerol phosphate synthase